MKLLIGFALFIFIGLVTAPVQCLAGATKGLNLCFSVIIPSLFPFFVCSKLFIETGAAKKLGKWCSVIMRPLFNVPGCGGFALVLGLLSGYPVRAKCAVDLYDQNLCTKAEAERIACFCNNSGPLFIIGSVGAGMMLSRSAGIFLYIIHILSALSVGLIFRFYKRNERMTLSCAAYRTRDFEKKSFGAALSGSIAQSVELTLYVCGFITFFSAFIVILEHFGIITFLQNFLGIFGVSHDVSKALSFGFFEITNGVVRLASLPIGSFKIVLISMLIAWSGISVIMQVTGIISKSDLNPYVFISAKAIQAAFAGIYAMILVRIPAGSTEVFAYQSSSYPNIWLNSLLLVFVGIAITFTLSLGCYIYSRVKR